MDVAARGRRYPLRLKEAERLVERLEMDNFNRALRINFLEEQLLAYERRLEPGALSLAEELQRMREAVQMRDAELSEAYGRLADAEAAMRRQRSEMDGERDRMERQARMMAEETAQELETVKRELAVCCVEKDELCSAKLSAEAGKRKLEETVEALQQQTRASEEDMRVRREKEQQERDRLEQALRQQTEKAAALRVEADDWRSKYVETASDAVGLRATLETYKKMAQSRADELKRFKVALATAQGAQRRLASHDEAVRVLLQQLKETQRLIDATKARMSKLDGSSQPNGESSASSTALGTLSAMERDVREIERALAVKA